MAATGNIEGFRDVLPEIVYDELWCRYQDQSGGVCFRVADACAGDAARVCGGARQRLTSLTRLQKVG